MPFGDLNTDAGLKVLNTFLEDKSYIEGYTPSQADVAVFEAMKKAPAASFPHALRWYNHIAHFGAALKSLPGTKKAVTAYGPAAAAAAPAPAPAAAAEDDDDIDLFGSDEEEDAEAEKLKAARLAEYNAKKAAKPKAVAKSLIIFDVKPWDDETDMVALEAGVREIAMEGLLWGTSKLMPVGFGIKKLQITCVIEDDKIGTDDLTDAITALEDYVQSVDIQAFNKL
ncbi:Translation elongation factor 1 beta [Polyrhizophydium stewartii]|uniref:Translation elongation factor 1 beta n=1 Tax=Polyrhizophydium stewartii TaxID=2732419 RepID=A0ABR4NE82_9FUNG|nr:Elongation factor 1-beta [Polyrhizophydium stewartii]